MARKTLLLFFVVSFIVLSGGKLSLARSFTIFGDAVPDIPAVGDAMTGYSPWYYMPVTLGVKFWSSQPGTISGIRFYRAAQSPQGYVTGLYSANGTLLGSATMAQESSPLPGWQEADFPSPIPISGNTTYVAAYFVPSGQFADTFYGLSQGVTNGPLYAPAGAAVGGNGVFCYCNGFPASSFENSNYFIDLVFTPTAPTSYLALNFDPPNPSITRSAPLGSVVATITASWSDGSPFTGSLSFGPPYSNDQGTFAISGNQLIINPSGPGVFSDVNQTLNVTIVATQ
jgi:hypothetical protein